jgi:very-short-patch-repair endonuclease
LELDGGIHEAERQKKHDENRTANLTALGYVILRFTNQQIFEDPESIFTRIAEFLDSRDSESCSPSSPSGRGGPGR